MDNILPKNLSEKQYFIHACFVDDLQSFYKNWIDQGSKKGRAQFFYTLPNGKLIHRYWNPSSTCCETGQELTLENIDVKIGYWTPFVWKAVRKDLRIEAMKEEAFECQKIDCSCSDCKHLERSKKWCNKFDKETSINANLCHPQNQECFKHRRS